MGTNLTIRQRYFIRAKPKLVFAALSEPKGLTQWFLASAVLPHEKGAIYKFRWRGGYKAEGKVLDFIAGRKLSLSWPQWWRYKKFLGYTRVTFRVTPKANGTLLDLTHGGYTSRKRWVENYGLTCQGWAYYLMNLKSVLEHNRRLVSDLDNV